MQSLHLGWRCGVRIGASFTGGEEGGKEGGREGVKTTDGAPILFLAAALPLARAQKILKLRLLF